MLSRIAPAIEVYAPELPVHLPQDSSRFRQILVNLPLQVTTSKSKVEGSNFGSLTSFLSSFVESGSRIELNVFYAQGVELVGIMEKYPFGDVNTLFVANLAAVDILR